MSELLDLLRDSILTQCQEFEVAVLLSGGLDSVTIAIAAEKVGKKIHAYTFCLEGYASRDLKKAGAITAHFGWPLTVVKVPTAQAADDFLRLAVTHRCKKKTQFEVTLPLLYLLGAIKEREVLTGFNADDYYGNDRETIFRQRRLIERRVSRAKRKEAFDAERRAKFEALVSDPDCGDTWCFAQRVAADCGKRLLDPYLDERVRDYFLHFDHQQLSAPTKPLVRTEFASELARLPRSSLVVGVLLQTGGRVCEMFNKLLGDERVNRFEKNYGTVSALCQRWGREVASDPDKFESELQSLPAPTAAVTTTLCPPRYTPYTMENVRRASAAAKFTVVATFAGGGGSCVGFRLAGGQVKLANEFVREAARTYRANFPEVPIDERDIRLIAPKPEEVEAFLAQGGLTPGEFDVLSGSFPCAQFSTAGRGFSDQHRMRTYSDTRQAGTGTLIYDFIKLAHMARPRVVIAENVPALVSRYGTLFRRAVHELRFAETGERLYYVAHAVLSSADFGVAQARNRLFVVGIRQDVAEAVGITSDEAVSFVFPDSTHLPVSVRSALADLGQTEADVAPWRTAAMTRSLGRYVHVLPRDSVNCVRLRHAGFSTETRFTLVRAAWDLPAPTLTASGQRRDAFTGVVHPDQDRLFSLPELKRLTGLPDDFVLTGTLDQAAERVGRMVTPFVMQALAESIHKRILKPYSGGQT